MSIDINALPWVKPAETRVTAYSAKKLLGAFLATQDGITYTKLTAKTVDFPDLARKRDGTTDALFVKVHGWTPHPAADAVKTFGKQHGFIVQFEGGF